MEILVVWIEGQITGDRTRSQFAAEFILLTKRGIGAELKIVPADNLAHIVPVGVGRVRVVSAIGDVACVFSKAAVVGISDQVDSGKIPSPLPGKISGTTNPAGRCQLPTLFRTMWSVV